MLFWVISYNRAGELVNRKIPRLFGLRPSRVCDIILVVVNLILIALIYFTSS
jgi:hypothetical protein